MEKRGITVEQMAGTPLSDERQGVVPCYVGQAPVWQTGDNWEKLAGSVLLINSVSEMRQAVGYYEPDAGAWEKEFSLCEAARMHENEGVWPIILLVNASVPKVETKKYSGKVQFAGGIGELREGVGAGEGTIVPINGRAVLSTVEIEGRTKGTDYTAEYSDNGQYIIIRDLKAGTEEEMKEADAGYQVIGDITFAADTFEEMDYFEQTVGIVPDFLGAPGWSAQKTDAGDTVADRLIGVAEGTLNGHWYTEAFVQLEADTREGAEKEREEYGSHKVKLVWPYGIHENRIYNGITWWMCKRQQQDTENDTIPYKSASNETVSMERLCTRTGETIRQKQSLANSLNASGIATFNFAANAWRTWGVCMANYRDEDVESGKVEADRLNDVAVQMKDYISNLFQTRYADMIDKPMSRRDCNNIVQDFGNLLAGYVTAGILVYQKVEFLENENSTASLAKGDFTFSVAETNTPPGKSITARVYYSAEALENSYREE